jgi:hypothetical protein
LDLQLQAIVTLLALINPVMCAAIFPISQMISLTAARARFSAAHSSGIDRS